MVQSQERKILTLHYINNSPPAPDGGVKAKIIVVTISFNPPLGLGAFRSKLNDIEKTQ